MKRMFRKTLVLLVLVTITTNCSTNTDDNENNNENTIEIKSNKRTGILNGHEWVDLGLPSGTLWATCNVGANSPEEYGDYFAWGETKKKNNYNWNTYKFYKGSGFKITKYCSRSTGGYQGRTDNLTVLQPSDDAATINWGDGWRMPTKEEWQELLDMCWVTGRDWTTQNGVHGFLFTRPYGTSLFLPAAGYHYNNNMDLVNKNGQYWSSTLVKDSPYAAWLWGFSSVGCSNILEYRIYGFSVRPVCSKSVIDEAK